MKPDISQEKIDILLVDDRPDGLVTLEAVLSAPGYNLVTARSGREALACLLNRDFAVIILDVQMPDMDGFETASLIKQRERSKYIPIIFVTAINKTSVYVAKGYEVGAVDYIFKPFDPMLLKSKVDVFADLYRKNRKLNEHAALLKRSEESKRSIIESARDIITTTDLSGKITSLSPAYQSITGFDGQERIGKPFDSLFTSEDVEISRKAVARVVLGKTALLETKIETANGHYVWVESSIKPLVQEGYTIGTLAVMRDITERLTIEKERGIRRELERSNKELEQFAHICSHDLQEPLRTINSYAHLLKQRIADACDPDTLEIIQNISSGAVRMSLLIRDLLAYAEFGSREFPIEPFDSAKALGDAMKNLQRVIEENQAIIQSGEMPVILGNSTLVTQVFQNLISNAIKFRGEETPKITISSQYRSGQWQFAVQDNGIGFKMEYSRKIFEIFKRLHHYEEIPGTGIGLGVCKRIVERQGGEIWAESEVGKGSTFYFTLPEAAMKEAVGNG